MEACSILHHQKWKKKRKKKKLYISLTINRIGHTYYEFSPNLSIFRRKGRKEAPSSGVVDGNCF